MGTRPERRGAAQHPPVRRGWRACERHSTSIGGRTAARTPTAPSATTTCTCRWPRSRSAREGRRSSERHRPRSHSSCGCASAVHATRMFRRRRSPCLWPDEGAQWQPVIDRLGAAVAGRFARRLRPEYAALWPGVLGACVVAGTVDVGLPGGKPIVYLPGVGRSDMRAADNCPPCAGSDRRAAIPKPVVFASEQPRLDRSGFALPR